MSVTRVAATALCLATASAGAAAFATAAVGAGDAGTSSAEVTSPNVIMILADDLGYEQTSMNAGAIATPNIDRITEQGVRFTDGYVAAPVCTPSRQALMTGRHPSRHGGHSNLLARTHPERLPSPTVGNILDARGYTTHAVGKWDLAGFPDRWDDDQVTLPHKAGFDSFYGTLRGMEQYCTGQGKVWRSLGGGQYEEFTNSRYMTDEYTENAQRFVRDHAGDANPFFLYLSYTAPHAPIQSPETCPDKDVSPPTFERMVEVMDDGIGRVLDALGPAADNTMVVFVSDHGSQFEQFFPTRLRDGKYSLFEGGVRVPFAMRWPARFGDAPVTYRNMVSTLDLLPTIAGASGAEVSGYPGTNLIPYLTGERSAAPHERLYWRYVEDKPVATQGRVTCAIRSGDYKYLRRTGLDGGTEEFLFDLSADPGETTNLAGDPGYARVRDRLLAEHRAWNAGNRVDRDFEHPRPAHLPRGGKPDGFISYGGDWTVEDTGGDREYRGTPDADGGRSMLAGSYYEDVTSQVAVRLDGTGRAGVVVRGHSEAVAPHHLTGYRVSLGTADDSVTLHKVVDGVAEPVAGRAHPIDPGTTYGLKVDVVDGTVTVFLDDHLQFRWTDTRPIEGGALGFTTSRTTASFDDLTAKRTI